MNPEQLLWTKPRWTRREYFLMRDGVELARVAFRGWRAQATAESAGRTWELNRSGILKTRVTMNAAREPAAVSAAGSWSGNYELEVPMDGAVRWKCLSVWKGHYGWVAADGSTLVRYRPVSAFSSTHFVELAGGRPLDELRVPLILLGGYLLALTQEDMAASAAAVTAAS
jgi:hypothetical protein